MREKDLSRFALKKKRDTALIGGLSNDIDFFFSTRIALDNKTRLEVAIKIRGGRSLGGEPTTLFVRAEGGGGGRYV